MNRKSERSRAARAGVARDARLWSFLRATIASIALILPVSGAGAANLHVVDGQLFGASGVDVGGTLYDVELLDGTCIALFDGCDSNADLPFPLREDVSPPSVDVELALQALLDQVFLDVSSGSFDTHPELTRGCEDTSYCVTYIPWNVTAGGTVFGAYANNFASSPDNFGANAFIGPDDDFTTSARINYAVWTVVPEPGTALLLGVGLVALGIRDCLEN